RQTANLVSSPETQSLVNNNNNNHIGNNNNTFHYTTTNSNIQSTVAVGQNSHIKYTEDYVNIVKMFHQYDILETSYHLMINRTELHFCDETKE
ncbi:unnamed protein product, partial [Schistosoma turkestanicum]